MFKEGLGLGLGLGLGFVKYRRSVSGKRIAIVSNNSLYNDTDNFSPVLKKQCVKKMSRLEDLPDEILIKVLCGVDHSDLKQLFQVSKLIRETTLIAKKQYFEYNTPKKIPARNSIVLNDSGEIENGEILNAPRKMRNHRRRRMSEKDMREISVALFSSSVEYLEK